MLSSEASTRDRLSCKETQDQPRPHSTGWFCFHPILPQKPLAGRQVQKRLFLDCWQGCHVIHCPQGTTRKRYAGTTAKKRQRDQRTIFATRPAIAHRNTPTP